MVTSVWVGGGDVSSCGGRRVKIGSNAGLEMSVMTCVRKVMTCE